MDNAVSTSLTLTLTTQEVTTILQLLGQVPTEYGLYPLYTSIETQLYDQLPELNPKEIIQDNGEE